MNEKRQLWIFRPLIVLVAAGLLEVASIPVSAARQDSNRSSAQTFAVDVAVDIRTFAIVPSTGNPPGKPAGPNRGTPFIVNGKIFPAGVLPTGTAHNDPGAPGSIGDWICKGILTSDLQDHLSGAEKIGFDTTQMFIFGSDKTAIWTEGLEAGLGEAGVKTHRIILGGTGQFRSASGEALQDSLGTNATGAPNIRLTFTLAKHDRD